MSAIFWGHLGLLWVQIESTAVEIDRRLVVFPPAVPAGSALDRHDFAVCSFGYRIGDAVCAVAHDDRATVFL